MIGRTTIACTFCFALFSAMGAGTGLNTFAASYYWDTNGTSAGIGSAGGAAANWLSNSWATGSSGTLATGAWPNVQPNADEAVFQGTAGTVNVNAAVYANALRFLTHNYILASTGGQLHLDGADPTITVNLPSGNNTSTISAPILGANGFTLAGNSLTGGLKFLVLANTNAAVPNAFAGTLTIEAGGALRLSGGLNEQIPNNVDLAVAGVIDFNTSGGASDGKQEQVRNVTVSGSVANFSVGNEADFIVNSISASSNGSGQGIAINGNNGLAADPHVPGRLIINGWADGAGHMTLDGGRVRINVTGAITGVGGRVLLSGNLTSSGSSEIWNHNGGSTSLETNVFANKALDFTGAAHTIDVASGTLTLTSRAATKPLDVTATNPGGTVLTKTGAGVWLYEHAVQTSFSGTNRIEQGTLRIGASERLANGAQLEVAGGTFDMQSFVESVGGMVLEGGTIAGTAAARLIGASFDVRAGMANTRLDGIANLTKTTGGTATLAGANTYSGTTTVSAGTLLVNGSHTGGGNYIVEAGGTLGGTGSIGSNAMIEGKLSPGNSIGTLSVQSDVAFQAGSRLHVEVDALANTSDRLEVVGNLNLSGAPSLDVLLLAGSGPSGPHTIATYTGTLTGTFGPASGIVIDYGTGSNSEISIIVNFSGVAGDYTNDGAVDAADYTVWRDHLGQSITLPNDQTPGIVTETDYDVWKANFGMLGGAGSVGSRGPAVPEGDSAMMVVLAIGSHAGAWPRRRC